jgi:hypothetical protein
MIRSYNFNRHTVKINMFLKPLKVIMVVVVYQLIAE